MVYLPEVNFAVLLNRIREKTEPRDKVNTALFTVERELFTFQRISCAEQFRNYTWTDA